MATFEELVQKHNGVLRPTSELPEHLKAALLNDLIATGKAPTLVAQFPTSMAEQEFEAEVNAIS